ncbi:uncharacterized protein LOC106179839 [Lingula anatina]|uniref:Endoglucanase n=1 Tax=Lingula anatina TaxID=7574 RepID=A0A1S3K9G1_LINAN|nr:uncharacterized protein LOC106179839 [Lingula anatina]|eukprot:XP_013419079.1 uncharacterized protein LOC106179839 [Lingula anatina]
MYSQLLLLLIGACVARAEVKVINSWNDGFQANINAPVTKSHNGWEMVLTFDRPLWKLEIWDADIIRSEQGGKVWHLKNKGHNAMKNPGESIAMTFVARGGASSATVRIVGQDGGGTNTGTNPSKPVVDPVKPVTPTNTKYNYDDVLHKSILFYEAQRSGKLPSNNRVPWRGDSALGDRGRNGEDLTGGWYDAGDHVKFGLPMGWSTMTLTWGLVDYKDAYVAAGEYNNMLSSVKWPLDYFIKAHTSKNELYVQVGDGYADHGFWGRPEDMNMNRPAFKVTSGNPGSDVVGQTAGAMAAGYMAFKDSNAGYAATLLRHAKELYDFGSRSQGIYTNQGGIPAKPFYVSQSYKDDLCVAAAWLYRATKEAKYLNDAKRWAETSPSWAYSWDDNKVSCQLLLYIATKDNTYKSPIESYMRSWMRGGDVTYTPKGLAWRLQWGSLRYAANTAFIALRAADAGINTNTYKNWAQGQIHYMLGDTGRSYVVGFGNNPPTQPHHRAASCPMRPAPCGSAQQNAWGPNPQVLNGALVGGPGSNDEYTDSRNDYIKNEVATDYNAGFQSAIAGLKHWALQKQ